MTKGIYSLIIHLSETLKIKVGSLGEIEFPNGYYIYTGSALNNLEARVERHKRKDKKLRWHIDYFLEKANLVRVFTTKTDDKLECKINEKISKFSHSYIKNFGCSDCNCRSHLYHLKDLDDALKVVKAVYSYEFI